MATIWDAARALLAMTGSEEAAVDAARELATSCKAGGEHDEAAFWVAVEDAVPWEANPQPLIAPEIWSMPRREQRGSMRRYQGQLELPKHRSNVLRFRRELRELWNRYRPENQKTGDSEDEN